MRTAPGADAPKQRKSSERGQQLFSCGTQAIVDTISASDCTILFMCDLRVILYVEKDAMTVTAPSLDRV